jgi:hypothetical protein
MMEHVCVPPGKIRYEEKSVQQESDYSICACTIRNISVPRIVSCVIFSTLSISWSSSMAHLESTTQSMQCFARTNIIPKVLSVRREIQMYQCGLRGCRIWQRTSYRVVRNISPALDSFRETCEVRQNLSQIR